MGTSATEFFGKRALVTGASSGIGAAIARELAALGVDLVLTARRRDALEAVAATCKGMKVEIVTADLGKPDAARELWAAATTSGSIDILINNAGFGYFRRFDEVDWSRDAELIQLNMTSLVALARCFVEARQANPGPAHMLNIASTGAYQSVPNMALYAASKAFVRNFSEALHDEHRGTPLSVTCICPGGTETAFHAASGGGDYSWIANASTKSAEFVACSISYPPSACASYRGAQRQSWRPKCWASLDWRCRRDVGRDSTAPQAAQPINHPRIST